MSEVFHCHHRPISAIPISEAELSLCAGSSGPGGQHVQRTETKVELLFDLAGSPSLREEQRRLALSRVGRRVDQQGILHLVSQAGRSQADNRADVLDRFRRLLAVGRPARKRAGPRGPRAAARRQRMGSKSSGAAGPSGCAATSLRTNDAARDNQKKSDIFDNALGACYNRPVILNPIDLPLHILLCRRNDHPPKSPALLTARRRSRMQRGSSQPRRMQEVTQQWPIPNPL